MIEYMIIVSLQRHLAHLTRQSRLCFARRVLEDIFMFRST